MTDDEEKAQAVQEGLAGIVRCDVCGIVIPEHEWVVIRFGPPFVCSSCRWAKFPKLDTITK